MVNNNTQNQIPNLQTKHRFLSIPREFVNPKRDWITLIIILNILVISAVGFDIYMYNQIVSGDMYVSVQKDELVIEKLKKNELGKILDVYESKKVNVINLKTNNLIDPSI